ncbi:MAG TPA: hypothetical protein VN426_02515 [Syntrophomonadaceae bacterium]|nr:hypothetical protein [Syntrophomonadaceae bacterium]
MLKKPGNRILIVLAALLVSGLLIGGAVPVMASGNAAGAGSGVGNCQGVGMGRSGGSMADIVSQTLGISRADLASERQSGKTLVDIAAEKGVNQEQLTQSVLEKRQETLKQALDEEKITQAQYDQCSQQMSERVSKNLTRSEVGPNGQGNGQGQGQGMQKNGGNGKGNGSGAGQRMGRCNCQ